MAMSDTMRAATIAAVLLAGSCAAPTNDMVSSIDPDVTHAITVEPVNRTVRLSFSAADAGLMPEDSARFDEFVGSYLNGGTGAISLTVPSGPTAQETIKYFGERLASVGVPRGRIMVGTRNDGDPRVELGFVSYAAHVDPCGNWSKNANDTGSNLPMPDFGCSVQHNIAAQIEDPRDLIAPRPMGDTDATRRAAIMGHYQKGEPTSATKTADQSVSVSDVKN